MLGTDAHAVLALWCRGRIGTRLAARQAPGYPRADRTGIRPRRLEAARPAAARQPLSRNVLLVFPRLVWQRLRPYRIRIDAVALWPAYAKHPLLRAVGIDRTYYAPISADQFAAYAAQVPDGFRFLVKAHELCTIPRFGPQNRYNAAPGEPNPQFLDPAYATEQVGPCPCMFQGPGEGNT